MSRQLSFFIIGTLLFWMVVAFLGRSISFLGGEQAVVYSATAALLCAVPAALPLVWIRRPDEGKGSEQVLWALLGMGLRMFGVLGGGIALYLAVPSFQQTSFWICILVFYLFTLALETVLLLRVLAARPGVQG